MRPSNRTLPGRLTAVLLAVSGWVIFAAGAESASSPRPVQKPASEWADSFGVPKPGLAPVVFLPGVVSTAENELFLRFSPDGNEIWWNSYGSDPTAMKTLRMVRRGEAWSAPSEVTIEGGFFEHAHFFSPDGRRRFFGCNRALPGEAKPAWRRIWYRDRRGDGWAAPALLTVGGRALDGAGGSVAADGTLYLIAGEKDTPDQGGDIFVCRRAENGDYLPPVRLGPEINSPFVEEHVSVAPDQSYLLFSSRRPTFRGEDENDLYVSFRKPDGGWFSATNLGANVNSSESDAAATLSPDGHWLFFASNRSGHWEIYWVDARILESFRPPSGKGPYFGQAPPGLRAERFAPGIISIGGDEHGVPVFAPGGSEFYLMRIVGPPWTFANSRFRMAPDGSWSQEAVRFDHTQRQGEFVPSRDGKRLYCTSLRQIAANSDKKIWKLWVMDLDGTGGPSRPLPPPINSPSFHECQLFEAADGSLYFTSWRNGSPDLYRAVERSGKWVLDEGFGPGVNSPQEDKCAFVTEDGGLLMFQSNRPGGHGQDDIYLSRKRADGSWGAPVNAGPSINSPFREWYPRLSPDGRYLFFLSDRAGDFDVYWIDADVLKDARSDAAAGSDGPPPRPPAVFPAPTRAGQVVLGERYVFKSASLEGDIPVRVHLPAGYEEGKSSCPVLYMLDIRDDFNFASTAADFLAACGRIPGLIVVSVDVDKLAGPPAAMIAFLEKDLFPFIERSYRTRPRRVLYGHSGRSFAALYVLIDRPELVDDLICPGVGLSWPVEPGRFDLIGGMTQLLARNPSFPKTLVLSLGDEPKFFAALDRFTSVLKEKAPRDFRWTYLRFPEDDHVSTKLKTLYQGLEFIFKPAGA